MGIIKVYNQVFFRQMYVRLYIYKETVLINVKPNASKQYFGVGIKNYFLSRYLFLISRYNFTLTRNEDK